MDILDEIMAEFEQEHLEEAFYGQNKEDQESMRLFWNNELANHCDPMQKLQTRVHRRRARRLIRH